MTDYIPPALDWVREQVELYESSGGTEGTTPVSYTHLTLPTTPYV